MIHLAAHGKQQPVLAYVVFKAAITSYHFDFLSFFALILSHRRRKYCRNRAANKKRGCLKCINAFGRQAPWFLLGGGTPPFSPVD
jgi:hypothetical protein